MSNLGIPAEYTRGPGLSLLLSITPPASAGILALPTEVPTWMIRLQEPLAANPQAIRTDENVAVPLLLSVSVGNGGSLGQVVLEPPLHGTLTGRVPDLVYTPNPNFHGSDQRTFEARYGRARAEAAVTMVVHPGNRLPVALNEVADLGM